MFDGINLTQTALSCMISRNKCVRMRDGWRSMGARGFDLTQKFIKLDRATGNSSDGI